MAEAYLVLGQSNPSATTLTDLYTVPGSTQAVVSTVIVANRDNATTMFRLSVAKAGAVDDLKQYLAYDCVIYGNALVALTLGVTLGAADVVRVYATDANLTFQAFGIQKT